MNISGYNPDVTDLEKTFLTTQTAASTPTTVLKVKNTNRFPDTQRVLIGAPKRERTEMSTQSAHTATTLTLGVTNFRHDADDPIYALDFDQMRFYRSTTGVNGTYALLSGGTVDIDWDNANGKTVYNDPNALSTYFYKVSFYDSIGDVETELSAPIQATGYADNTVGSVMLQMLDEVDDLEQSVFSINTLLGIMNNISKDLLKQAKKPYRFLKTKQSVDVEADDESFPWPADLWKVNYIELNQYNGTGTARTFNPKKVDLSTMKYRQSLAILPSDYVNEIAYNDEDKTIEFNPAARTERLNAFIFHYYKKFALFTDLSNPLETPDDLVYMFGLKRAFYLRKADDDGKYFDQYKEFNTMYQTEVRMLQREKNVDVHGPDSMGPDRRRYSQFGLVRRRQ